MLEEILIGFQYKGCHCRIIVHQAKHQQDIVQKKQVILGLPESSIGEFWYITFNHLGLDLALGPQDRGTSLHMAFSEKDTDFRGDP